MSENEVRDLFPVKFLFFYMLCCGWNLFSRPSECLPSQLSLYELIGMMVDVGRGAAYLEANRHVHRDLAARNCLISSRNSNTRITKIGNF